MSFGTRGESCGKLMQDLTVYLKKCPSYCTTCTDGGTLKQFGSTACLSSCPVGYYVSGTDCLQTKFCHSSCTTCASLADSAQCSACSSTVLTGLAYYTLNSSVGSCHPIPTDTTYPNIYVLTSLNRDTAIGGGFLTGVKIGTINTTTTGTKLSDLTFNAGLLLNFDTLTLSTITFYLTNLSLNHMGVYVRFRAKSLCQSLTGKTQDIIVEIDGTSSTFTPNSIDETVY
jgi:hypothetical protein